MIFSSFFEGRGMARISLKYFQMEDGSNSSICSFMLFYFDGSKLIKSNEAMARERVNFKVTDLFSGA
jgi:hypothetical protein